MYIYVERVNKTHSQTRVSMSNNPQVIHLFPYKNTIFSYLLYNFFPIDENDFIFY